MRKKKDNKSQQSATGQQSSLEVLAATCSKLEETESPGGKNQANNVQQTLKVINSGSQVINATDLAQYMQLAGPGQTLGIVNADGTITQITNSQMPTGTTSAGMKSMSGQNQITQLAQAGQLSSGGVAYSIIPAGQVQNIQIDGQEAIYIPASSFGTAGQQTFQIAGTNQIFTQQATSQPSQTVVRTSSGTGQSTSTTQQTAVIQGVQNLNNMTQLTQLAGGQTVAIARPGNMMQTLQLPVNSLQQTIPVQMPMQTQSGQMIYQTIQMPISSISGLTGQQVVQQMPQIQMAQIQLPQQTGTGKDGTLDATASSQSQVNSNAQQATNQNVIATINLPNGQLGQLISPQSVWPTSALNLSNLTGW